jgi:anti-sigma-K factor RskA
MNYQSESLRNALAAEYVLGTLRGPARQRFQKLMMQYPLISEATHIWEQHLNGLGQKIPAVQPDAKVWLGIEQQLGFVAQPAKDNVVAITKNKPRVWQGIAGLASAAAVVLAVLVFNITPAPEADIQQLAMVNNEQTELLWAIEVSADSIDVRVTKKLVANINADYELWIVAADGRPPISLGLLPKTGQLTLSKPKLFEQIDIAALAVSLEPIGGSPNGAPTKVLYTTQLAII